MEERKGLECANATCKKNAGLACIKCGIKYCSKQCQKVHWKKVHKQECGKIADTPIKLAEQVESAMVLKGELRYNSLDESNVNELLEKMFHQCTKNIERLASEHSEEGPWNPNYSEYTDKPLYIFRDVCQQQEHYLQIQYGKYQQEIASLEVQKDRITSEKGYVEKALQKSLKHSSILGESPLLVELNTKLQEINIKLKKINSLSKLNSDTTHSFAILLHKINAIPKCLICGADTDPPNAVEMCECENVKYCSRACQTADWNAHKLTCMVYKA